MKGAPRYLRFGLLVVCLSLTVSAYANSRGKAEQTDTGGEKDGLLPRGSAGDVSHDSSSLASAANLNRTLLTGTAGAPGSKFAGKGQGFSGGGDLKPINPPLPPVENAIPEPGILLDLGMGLAAFATLWNFKMRRAASCKRAPGGL